MMRQRNCSKLLRAWPALWLATVFLLAMSPLCEAKVRLQWSTWLGGDQLSVLTARTNEFEKQNPDLEVEMLSYAGTDYKAKLLTMVAAGSAPDVAHSVVYDAPFYIDRGMLLDVTSMAREIRRSDYYISDIYVRDGRVYGGFETHVQVYPLFYQPDRFSEAGVPSPNDYAARGAWNWQTFREVARRLTRVGSDGQIHQYGTQVPTSWETGWGVIGLSNGAEMVNADMSRVAMDSPAMLDSLRLMLQLLYDDHVAPRPGEPLPEGDPLLNGSVAMSFQGSWRMNYYKQFAETIPWNIAPTPFGTSDRVYRAPGADGVVLASTKHPAEAWRLVRFFLSDYVQLDKARSKLEVPVLKRAITSSVYLEAPPADTRVVGDLLARSVPQPVFMGATEVRQAIEGQLAQAFNGQVALEAAVAEAQRLGQAKLDEFAKSKP